MHYGLTAHAQTLLEQALSLNATEVQSQWYSGLRYAIGSRNRVGIRFGHFRVWYVYVLTSCLFLSISPTPSLVWWACTWLKAMWQVLWPCSVTSWRRHFPLPFLSHHWLAANSVVPACLCCGVCSSTPSFTISHRDSPAHVSAQTVHKHDKHYFSLELNYLKWYSHSVVALLAYRSVADSAASSELRILKIRPPFLFMKSTKLIYFEMSPSSFGDHSLCPPLSL